MPIFLGIHKLPSGMSEEQVVDGFHGYKKAAHKQGLKALSVMYSLNKSFAYCQTEADSAEEVWKAHESVKAPLEDVVEVKTTT